MPGPTLEYSFVPTHGIEDWSAFIRGLISEAPGSDEIKFGSLQSKPMKLVIFGLTVSSEWGNGHATLWRGLCNAFARQGHDVTFFERDVSYYANNRDLLWPKSYKL